MALPYATPAQLDKAVAKLEKEIEQGGGSSSEEIEISHTVSSDEIMPLSEGLAAIAFATPLVEGAEIEAVYIQTPEYGMWLNTILTMTTGSCVVLMIGGAEAGLPVTKVRVKK